MAWDLWEHRNNILHTQTNAISKEKLQTANRKLSKLFCKYQAVLSSTIDKYLFEVPLQQLLQKDLHYKEEWIKNLKAAVQNKGAQASKSSQDEFVNEKVAQTKEKVTSGLVHVSTRT